MNDPGESRFRLGEFDVDPADHSITGPRGGGKVRESSMDVLRLLAERPGRFLPRRDLLHAIFPASGDPHGLLRDCVRELRDSLDDRGSTSRYIEFDEERGYRLLVPPQFVQDDRDDSLVTWFDELKRRRVFRVVAAYAVVAWLCLQIVDVLSGALPVPDWTLTATTVALGIGFPIAALLAWVFQVTPTGVEFSADVSRRDIPIDRTRLVHYIDLIVIGVLLVVVALLSYGRVFPMLGQDDEVRLAVLPFEDLSGDPGGNYLGDGIADDIRSRLYEIPQFLIAARSSSRALAGQGFDVGALGERLGVDHILEGTIRRAGRRLRINVQLVDVGSGFNQWDRSYDSEIDDVLDLQNQIALYVASELHVVLTRETREVLAHNVTDDHEAFDLYLRARSYLDRPRSNENLENASELFLAAIAKDERFALGYAGLCQTYLARYESSGDTTFVARATENCNAALAIDARLSEVHTALGHLHLKRGSLDAAEDAFDEAIDRDPRAVDAYSGLGEVYARRGDVREAEAQHRNAINLRPGNWDGYNRYARFLFRQGRYVESIENYTRAVDLAPDNANGYNNLGVVYYVLGDFDKAAENYQRSLELDPGRAAYSNTGTMYYYAGDFAAAARLFRRAAEQAASDYRIWGNLGDAERFDPASPDRGRASYEKAIELVRLELEVDPTNVDALTLLAWYLVNTGREDESRAALETAENTLELNAHQAYAAALVHTLLGDSAEAGQFIHQAISLGFPETILAATPELRDRPDVFE